MEAHLYGGPIALDDAAMRMYDIIKSKRDGNPLSEQEISCFIDGLCRGEIPDYQASALLMAIWFRGMDERETTALTMAMARSGKMNDLSAVGGVKVDKHSTGGVGTDTLIWPLCASRRKIRSECEALGRDRTHAARSTSSNHPGFDSRFRRTSRSFS